MPRLFEALESRTLFSAATLSQDETNLANAISQYDSDKSTSAMVIAADKAAVAANKVGKDPAVAGLINTWKQAILTRSTTLTTDQYNLTIATNTDKLADLQERQNIRMDKANGNTSQLAIDQSQLGADLVKLAADRSSLVATLSNDRITTKATIASDHEAILAQRLADGANPAGVAARQQLVADSIHWVDTLAVDRKTVAADRLIVAMDKHG